MQWDSTLRPDNINMQVDKLTLYNQTKIEGRKACGIWSTLNKTTIKSSKNWKNFKDRSKGLLVH